MAKTKTPKSTKQTPPPEPKADTDVTQPPVATPAATAATAAPVVTTQETLRAKAGLRVNMQLSDPSVAGEPLGGAALAQAMADKAFDLFLIDLPSLGDDAGEFLAQFGATVLKQQDKKDKKGKKAPSPVVMVITQPPQTRVFNAWMSANDLVEEQARHIFNRVTKAGKPKTRTFRGLVSNTSLVHLVSPRTVQGRGVLPRFVRKHTNQTVTGTSIQGVLDELAASMPAMERVYVVGTHAAERVRMSWFHTLEVSPCRDGATGGEGSVAPPTPGGFSCSLFDPRPGAPSACRQGLRLFAMTNKWNCKKLTSLRQSVEAFLTFTPEQQAAAAAGEADLETAPFSDMDTAVWLSCLPGGDAEDLGKHLRNVVLPQVVQAISVRKHAESGRGRKRKKSDGGERKKRKPAGITAPQQTSQEFNDFLFDHMQGEMRALGVDEAALASREALAARGFARTEGVKLLFAYMDREGKREGKTVHMNELLQGLIGEGKADSFTTFDLQRRMNKHFPSKKGSPEGVGGESGGESDSV